MSDEVRLRFVGCDDVGICDGRYKLSVMTQVENLAKYSDITLSYNTAMEIRDLLIIERQIALEMYNEYHDEFNRLNDEISKLKAELERAEEAAEQAGWAAIVGDTVAGDAFPETVVNGDASFTINLDGYEPINTQNPLSDSV